MIKKKYIIGIDLGTTNSCVSVMEGKNPKVISSQEGDTTVPSIISYKDGETLVGVAAKRQAVTNPKNTLYSTKRFIGRSFEESKEDIEMVPYEVINEGGSPIFSVDNKKIRPQQAAATVLEKMKETAEAFIGKDGEVVGAVITVPAYFNNTQKQATIDAGVIAGLDVKRLINEPTAAAIAYGLDKAKESKIIVVFDFGGGTFDVSVLEIGDGVIEVKATSGDNHLGGDDVDNLLINFIVDNFKKSSGIDIKKDPMALQRVKEASEKGKKELSSSISTEIILPFITMTAEGPQHLNLTITRNQFNELVDGLLDRLIKPCEEAVEKAGVSKSEINTILAVGGSTRIPLVKEKVKRVFGKEMDTSQNQDTVVAEGAAIQGAILSGDISDMVLLDKLPIAIGLETEGGIFTPIIKESETIPTANEETFTTAQDNQTSVTIRVLQGASEMASRNQEIGRFDLTGIAPAPRGAPQIAVKFEVTSNGVLHCTARDTKTGKEQTAEIVAKNGLSEEIVEKLKQEAEKYREEDSKKKEFIQAKHEVIAVAKQAKDVLKDFGDKISDDLKAEIESLPEKLEKLAESATTTEEIKPELEAAKQTLQKIGESVYAQQPNNPQEPQSNNGEENNNDNNNNDDVEVV